MFDGRVLYLDEHGVGKHVPAIVRFLGQGPEGGPGWMLGIEIQVATCNLLTVNDICR